MFNEQKTAQMAVYLLKHENGKMNRLKLMKLLYLAEREGLRCYGTPMTGDSLVSMDHGPVLSQTLDLARGTSLDSADDGWDTFIIPGDGHTLKLAKPVSDGDLDELSKADIQILEDIWHQFGHMTGWAIRDHTHTLPEWKNPHGTSLPITYEDVLGALGYTKDEVEALCKEIESEEALDKTFQSVC